MRRRLAPVFVAFALLACGAAPAAAAPDRAVTGRMLVAPGPEAVVTQLPMRVAVRAPAGTVHLGVHLGERDVSARFREGRGSLRVARLTRGDGLRYGNNLLYVQAQRRGARPVAQARSFVLVRRQAGVARLRLRPGPVTALSLRVAPDLAPRHFGQPGAFAKRLRSIRRERQVRVWLNGRRVTRALDRSDPAHLTARLSATHGLRHGVNRLRVLVVEPDRGRYTQLRRRFRVRRARPLPAAGRDVDGYVGVPVRLDGRRSRAARGRRLDHHWRILRKPRGSRAALRRAGSARPVLVPDRAGRYVVGLRLGAGSKHMDTVEAPARPDSALVPFKGIARQNGHNGIQVGDDFYPNPSPNESAMQWLTLDRVTLKPTKTGNSWLDGSGSGSNGVNALTTALASSGLEQLTILSYPYAGGPGPPVQQGQMDEFNRAMKTLGVEPIPQGVLQDHNKLAVVGVPSSGPGSGWYTHGGAPVEGLTGWLMLDSTLGNRFRFQPERAPFDTSSSHTPQSNTMTIRGSSVSASLPDGTTGGFQVVEINPIDFQIVRSDVYGSNGSWDGLGAMVPRLNEILRAGNAVAVQTIGAVLPTSPTWPQVAGAMAEFGANPHTFNWIEGRYAFLGADELEVSEVAESSATIVLDPTVSPATRQSGTLRGRVRMRTDGYVKPVATDPTATLEFPLYDIVSQPPQPWPFTQGGEAPAYAKALADITAALPDLSSWGQDLRKAYLGDDTLDYTHSSITLTGMPYPGNNQPCGSSTPRQVTSDPGYTYDQFCNLRKELLREFDWLDATATLFSDYQQVLDRTGNQQQVDLASIGNTVRNNVAPPAGADIASPLLQLIQSLFRLGGPVGGTISGAIGVVTSGYELGSSIASNQTGMPVGDRVETTVEQLSTQVAAGLSGAAGTFDSLRDAVISDYGRLSTLGPLATSPDWSFQVRTMATNVTLAANAYFYLALMPVAYDAWYLMPTDHNLAPTVDTCWYDGGTHFSGAPASAQVEFRGHFNEADDDERDHLLVLAHQQGEFSSTPWYPPSSLTDPMFAPIAQNGYGLYAPGFFWTQYPNAITPHVADCIRE